MADLKRTQKSVVFALVTIHKYSPLGKYNSHTIRMYVRVVFVLVTIHKNLPLGVFSPGILLFGFSSSFALEKSVKVVPAKIQPSCKFLQNLPSSPRKISKVVPGENTTPGASSYRTEPHFGDRGNVFTSRKKYSGRGMYFQLF